MRVRARVCMHTHAQTHAPAHTHMSSRIYAHAHAHAQTAHACVRAPPPVCTCARARRSIYPRKSCARAFVRLRGECARTRVCARVHAELAAKVKGASPSVTAKCHFESGNFWPIGYNAKPTDDPTTAGFFAIVPRHGPRACARVRARPPAGGRVHTRARPRRSDSAAATTSKRRR